MSPITYIKLSSTLLHVQRRIMQMGNKCDKETRTQDLSETKPLISCRMTNGPKCLSCSEVVLATYIYLSNTHDCSRGERMVRQVIRSLLTTFCDITYKISPLTAGIQLNLETKSLKNIRTKY